MTSMCGIAGYVGLTADAVRPAVRAMTGAMARRGPDSEGIAAWPDAVLGHRRLAILDLSEAGKQPMLSDDGETGLVFNGCIYNFQELRADLEKYGHVFRSQTDTEVLLRGYEQWGTDGLVRRLRGMFAFALWDNRQRKLWLVRDRLGVKPLVYAVRNGGIAFASTVTALREAGLAGELDPEAMLEFLEFGWVSDEHTIYSGVKKVHAATIIEWQQGQTREWTYWTPPEAGSQRLSFGDAVDATEELLLEAVRLRLISDVPIGALLSGGIDSSLICWALAKLQADVTAFTVSTPGDPADEADAARATAAALGIPHEVTALSADEQPALDDLTCAYGEPFACSSALAMLRVCGAIKPHATVLLTGDGGDDVFLGYTHHGKYLVAQQIARWTPGAAVPVWSVLRPHAARAGSLRRAVHLADFVTGGLGAVTQTHDGMPYYERMNLIGERFKGYRISHREIPHSIASARQLMTEFLEYERKTRFVAEYMTKVDGAAMYHSIEARAPFLDQRLWELAASLPVELRLRRGELKAVLRALARRNIGPQIASRRKQGFTVPVWTWLVAGWRPQLESMAAESILEREQWIRPGALRDAISAALQGGRAPVQLWSLVVLENWLRRNVRTPVAVS